MANQITATYSFTLPEVGADTNAWGGHINGNFSTIDSAMLSRSTVSAQTMLGLLNLPSNGLNVGTGQLQVSGGNVSMSGNLSVTGTQAFTGAATFTAAVTAATAPSIGNHLTNKTYVDAQTALKLSLTGGTMSGAIVLPGDPASALQAAPKQYVDAVQTTVGAYTVTGTGGLTGGGAISGSPSLSIASGGVGETQLASDAVTTVKILNANVTPAKLSQPFTSMGAVTASGTGVNFGSIPSWVKRITVLVSGTTFSVSDILQVQIGPAGGVETSGYVGYVANVIGAAGNVISGGFNSNFSSASAVHGRFVIELVGSNVWTGNGHIATPSGTNISVMQGSKSLAGTLTQLTVKGAGGQSFSGGTINVLYE